MPRKLKTPIEPIKESETIGSRIAEFRKKKGFTQEDLANRIGIARVLISDYERGKVRIYADMILRIAKALGVSTDDLLDHLKQQNDDAPSLKMMRRLKEIEKLPESDQKALLKTIDKYIS